MAAVDVILQIFNTVWLVIKYGWWLALIVMILFIKKRNNSYPIEAVIIEKRGNNHIKTNDRVGKYIDKLTGLTGYKFMKSKDTIPVVDFDWIMHNARQDLGIFDKLYNKLWGNAGTAMFYKYGSRQYKPVKVSEEVNAKVEWKEVLDENGNPLRISVLKPIDPRDKMSGLNFEVVDWDNMNFMVQEQRASIERRKKASELWKQILLPAMIIGGAVVVAIVMLKFGYDFAVDLKSSGATNPITPVTDPTNPNIPIIGDMLPK
jgi:hypothetical protein